MGWWAELTGKAGAQRAQAAAGEANKLLDVGWGQAYGSLDQSRAAQLAALQGGYDSAYGSLTEAEARAAGLLNQGADRASGAITDYYGRAIGNVEDYYNRTESLLNPSIQRGNKLGDLYATALGADGSGDQQAFYSEYAANDPFRAFRDEQANRQIQQQFNAQGQSGSGRFATAVGRASLERGSQDLNTYLDRLSQAGQQGQNASSQLASISSNTGGMLAGLNTGQGDKLSNIQLGLGSNLATNAGNFGNTRAGYQVMQGRENAGVEDNYGRTKMSMQTGLAQAKGGNLMGGANAANAARGAGLNNLFGLGALGIGAITPGKEGVSALGNLFAKTPFNWIK